MRGTFASFAVRNYRLWFIGALFGNTGTWMQRVAQDWIVLTVFSDDNGLAVGIVTALQFGPSLFISPIGGLLADRWNRRRVYMITQATQAALSFTLGGLLLTGQMNLAGIYIFAVLTGVVAGFEAPFFQTFVGQLVGPRLLANAVGLNSANFNVARMVGPAAAGLALAVWPAGWVFLANGLSFVFTVGAVAMMRSAELRPMPSAPRAKGQLRAGLDYVRRRSDIQVILVVIGVVSCFGLNSQLTMGVMARNVFDRQAGEYGILGSLFAVGAVAGALVAARRGRPRVRLVIGATLAFAVASGISALTPTYWAYAASGVLVGGATLTLITAANSTLQLSVEPQIRGRVLSIYMMVFLGATPIGAPMVGWIADAWGPRWSIGVGSIASLVIGVAAMIWAKVHWKVEAKFDHILPPHLVVANPAAGEHLPSESSDADSDAAPEGDPARDGRAECDADAASDGGSVGDAGPVTEGDAARGGDPASEGYLIDDADSPASAAEDWREPEPDEVPEDPPSGASPPLPGDRS
ncbi:MAG: MFS transporter [Bifidobacteriaceae bacterium]|jgi:MFS family permease|nr:MFS transporter [Bifidobacteriaceae bacterium]